AREAPPHLAPLLWSEPPKKAPQPGKRHLAAKAVRLLPGRAVLDLTPAGRLEKVRALGRCELEGSAAVLEGFRPAAFHELQCHRGGQIDQPPVNAGRMQIRPQRGDFLGLEIDKQTLAHGERAS